MCLHARPACAFTSAAALPICTMCNPDTGVQLAASLLACRPGRRRSFCSRGSGRPRRRTARARTSCTTSPSRKTTPWRILWSLAPRARAWPAPPPWLRRSSDCSRLPPQPPCAGRRYDPAHGDCCIGASVDCGCSGSMQGERHSSAARQSVWSKHFCAPQSTSPALLAMDAGSLFPLSCCGPHFAHRLLIFALLWR